EEADGRAAQHGEDRSRGEPEPDRADLELGEGEAGAVGAQPVVGGVAEGEQARVTVEQIEAEGEEAENQHLRGERLVGHEEREHREEDAEGDHLMAVHEGGESGHRHSARPASPKRPLGRTRSTIAITTNTMISASLGAKTVVMPTTCPTRIPATTAPSRLPMPPVTRHRTASCRRAPPTPAWAAPMARARAPASPASAQPMPKTSSQMRLRSMPRARTIRGSRVPARMMRPTLVRVRKTQSAM